MGSDLSKKDPPFHYLKGDSIVHGNTGFPDPFCPFHFFNSKGRVSQIGRNKEFDLLKKLLLNLPR